MPVYQYKCQEEKCQEEWDVFQHRPEPEQEVRCQCCGGKGMLQVSRPAVHAWKPIFLEHVSKTGEMFETKRQCKNYMKKHKLECNALTDGQ